MHKEYKDREDIVFVGASVETVLEKPEIEGFIETTGATWPNAYGLSEDSLLAFSPDNVLITVVTDRKGKIIWNTLSELEGRVSIETAIELALAEQPE